MTAQITRYQPNYRKTFECIKVHPDTVKWSTAQFIFYEDLSSFVYVFLHEINHYL